MKCNCCTQNLWLSPRRTMQCATAAASLATPLRPKNASSCSKSSYGTTIAATLRGSLAELYFESVTITARSNCRVSRTQLSLGGTAATCKSRASNRREIKRLGCGLCEEEAERAVGCCIDSAVGGCAYSNRRLHMQQHAAASRGEGVGWRVGSPRLEVWNVPACMGRGKL